MKFSAILTVSLILASLGAQANTMDCHSKSNRLRVQLSSPLENSVVSINGAEQMTGTVETSSGAVKLTVIDLEQASASILTIPDYQLTDEKDFLVMDVEYLGAPGTVSKSEQVVCQQAR